MKICLQGKNIKIIVPSNNFGHQAALTARLHHANGDVFISLDADLQDPHEVVEEMLIKYMKGYDIVYGVRKSRNKVSDPRGVPFIGYVIKGNPKPPSL